MRSLVVAALRGSGASQPVRIRIPLPEIVLPRSLRRPARLLSRIDFQLPRHFGLTAAGGLLLAVVVYGVIVGGHVGSVFGGLTAAAGLEINAIRISGQSETAELEVLSRLAMPDHGSLLSYDVSGALDRVEELSWVAEATVTKVYPDTLEVHIVERVPFALWQRAGAVALIDAGGFILSNYVAPRYRGLPLLVGAGAQSEAAAMLSLISEFPTLHARLRAATFVSGRRWDLTLSNGILVLLPESEAIQALVQLEALDQSQRLLSRDIVSVDLRLADRVVVALDGGALEEVQQTVSSERRAGGAL